MIHFSTGKLFKHILRSLLFAACIFCFAEGYSRNHYISSSGNDAANGRTAQSTWRTLQKLNKTTLQAGDTIFLQRGGVYEGTITVRQSGTAQKPIVITAYGDGPEPVISGSVAVNEWKPTGNNRYEALVKQPVYDLFINDLRQTPARYPNSGFLTIDKAYGKDSIECNGMQEPDGIWDGATLRIRPIDWVYETRTVKSYQKGLLIQGPQDRYLIEKSFEQRTLGGKTGIYPFQKGYGFYLEGLPAMVDTTGEWSWRDGKLLVQLPEGSNPNTVMMKAVVHHYGVWIAAGVRHVTIKGLEFSQLEKAGIGGSWHIEDITVTENLFHDIHGSGVWFDSASARVVITRNRFSDILGRGISLLESGNSEIAFNDLKRIGLSRGHGWSGVNGASGILLHNTERKVQFDTTFAHHNIVRYNRVDSCGYNGIRVDGHHNLVEYNVIEHCSLTLNDGANLYCFAAGPGVTHHSIFRNNIVRYSIGDSKATPGNPNLAFGIYIDNNSYDMLVEGNTVISTGASGILNNDASYNNTFRNNTIYDCEDGLGFAEWANVGKLYGLLVEGNTVIATKPKQWAVSMTNWLAPKLDVGVMRNNRYINTASTNFFYYTTKQFPDASRLPLSFEQYQRIINNEQGSSVVSAITGWVKDLEPVIYVNDSATETTIKLVKESRLTDSTMAAEMVSISPFSSIVILQPKIAKK